MQNIDKIKYSILIKYILTIIVNFNMKKNVRKYTDLDLTFTKNPLTNDIAKKVDSNAIKQSIKNLVQMEFCSVPFHPEIGSQVMSLLFENFTDLTRISLERVIATVIENFEPRVRMNSVIVTNEQDKNAILITIYYNIINTNKPQSVDITVYRAR